MGGAPFHVMAGDAFPKAILTLRLSEMTGFRAARRPKFTCLTRASHRLCP